MARTHLVLGVLASMLASGCAPSGPVAPPVTAGPTADQDASPSQRAAMSPTAAPTHSQSSFAVASPTPKPAWRTTARMPREREGFDAVVLGDGTVLVVGNDGDPLADDPEGGADPDSDLVDLYDPTTGSWTSAERLNKPRRWAAALALPDGSAMVVGGINSDGEPFSSTKLFSPATRSWTSGPLMTVARAFPEAVTLGDGRVLVVGSGATSGTEPSPGDTSEVYDPASGAWTGQTRLPRPGTRVEHLLRLGETGALAVGVYETGDTDNLGEVGFVYTADSNRWTQVEFPWVFEPSLITLPDGDVLAAGGGGGGDCCRGVASVKDVYRFDHETLQWRELSPLPSPREAIALAILRDGRVLAAGGVRVREPDADDGTPVKLTELYDPATDTWSRGPNLLEPGGGATAVVLADGGVLLLGGSLTAPEQLTLGP